MSRGDAMGSVRTMSEVNDGMKISSTRDGVAGNGQSSGRVVSAFASLAPETLIDETVVALALRVSKRTVRRMVARYELPPPVRLGGRSMWRVSRIAAWFERRADRLEREARRRSELR
jgi:predicted DNA-binding transcriptional regulator AlpA